MRKKESGRGGQKERGQNVLQPLQLMSKMSLLLAPLKLGLEICCYFSTAVGGKFSTESLVERYVFIKVFGSVQIKLCAKSMSEA